ncbi:MAG TPA: ribonuclease P protein component [Hyphomicrobiaceae bacterium]|nr:ribonuclease P protein component [Hyphomicrobiaceae bacterium]
MALVTLKKRQDFLRLRGGARFVTPGFVLEAKPQPEGAGCGPSPRFGFTVTKATGAAVVRNRIRRRLRAAVRLIAPDKARAGHDYVLIARAAALERSFPDLKKDLERALQRVHDPAGPEGRARDR